MYIYSNILEQNICQGPRDDVVTLRRDGITESFLITSYLKPSVALKWVGRPIIVIYIRYDLLLIHEILKYY